MKLGFIGTGKIASSVITGICNSKIQFNKILISPRNKKIASKLKKNFKKVLKFFPKKYKPYVIGKIVKRLNKIPEAAWQVFSKHSKKSYTIGNVSISPIDSKLFLNSIASSSGVLTNAGFGTTSEALFLKKKLLVVPMKKQYEQQCNAAMLQDMGIKVIKKFDKKSIDLIDNKQLHYYS